MNRKLFVNQSQADTQSSLKPQRNSTLIFRSVFPNVNVTHVFISEKM